MNLLIVHHVEIYRYGLSSGLNRPDLKINSITMAQSGKEAIIRCKSKNFDAIIVDMDLPEISGAQTIRKILTNKPKSKILAMSRRNQIIDARTAYNAGAMGYLSLDNDFKTIALVLKQIANGNYYVDADFITDINPFGSTDDYPISSRKNPELSRIELEALQYFSEGKNSKEIGIIMYRAKRTIDSYRNSICKKFGVKTTIEAVAFAIRKGLVVEKNELDESNMTKSQKGKISKEK